MPISRHVAVLGTGKPATLVAGANTVVHRPLRLPCPGWLHRTPPKPWSRGVAQGHGGPCRSSRQEEPDIAAASAQPLPSDSSQLEPAFSSPELTPTAPTTPPQPQDPPGLLKRVAQSLRELRELLSTSFSHFFSALDTWWLKTLAVFAFVLTLVSCVINFALVPLVNYELLPTWQAAASRVTQRQIRLGRCSGVSLAGVTGAVPLVHLGPCSVGPGPYERSSLIANNGVAVYIDPVASIAQQQVVLALAIESPEVTVVQGNNFSWLGYPDDTIPSSRNLLPGLPQQEPEQQQREEEVDTGIDVDSQPPVALGRVRLRNGNLAVVSVAERVPRYVQYISGVLQLGHGYRSLDLHLQADAHVRHKSSDKCTLVNPHSKRHLRHVTAGSQHPAPIMFGCDEIPRDVSSRLAINTWPAVVDDASEPAQEEEAGAPQGVDTAEVSEVAGSDVAGDADEQGTAAASDASTAVHASTASAPPAATPAAAATASSTSGVLRATPAAHTPTHTRKSVGKEHSAQHTPQPVLPRSATKPAAGEGAVVAAGRAALSPAAGSQAQGVPLAQPLTAGLNQMVRQKRGRAAEVAAAAGEPLEYVLNAHGVVLTEEEERFAAEHEAAHQTAIRTGDPHHWLHAPWAAYGARRPPTPTGGRLEVHLTATHVNTPARWPDMLVTIKAQDLHAPLLERLLELPMDILDGRLTGELRIKTYDQRSWQTPELYGNVDVQGAHIHFWDASDDLQDTRMQLLLERDRMYLHGAKGWFGAVPLSVTGDLDLNAETGSYRLSATVQPGVEINALRATLGVRPVPQPVSGGLRGVLHCTGPLEQPVFSGTAVAVRPPYADLLLSEPSPARDALLATPSAVVVFDKFPILSASAVFTLDTSTQRFTLHSAQGVPLGGGQASGQGTMWLAPEAESHPEAISMQGEVAQLDPAALITCYLPDEVRDQLPAGALSSLGLAHVRGTMHGSHLAPEVAVTSDMPRDSRLLVSASAAFSPTAMAFTARGPALSLDTTLHISTPTQDLVRTAHTQAEATRWAHPRFQGVDLSASLSGFDLLHLQPNAAAPALDPVSSGQPLRAKCTGSIRCSLRPVTQPAALPGGAGAGGSGRKPPVPGGAAQGFTDLKSTHPSLLFTGPISMSNLRINSLEVVRSLSGQLGLSGLGKVLVRARGTPPASPLTTMANAGLLARPAQDNEMFDLEASAPDLLPALNLSPEWMSSCQGAASAKEVDEVSDSRCSLRRGGLVLDASSAGGGKEYLLVVGGLPLDPLESGSLRGTLTSAVLEANMEARQGAASLSLDSVRYASLAAETLSSRVRWEGSVVKLEEAVLVQKGSRYEVAGEVFLPELLGQMGPATAGSPASTLAGSTPAQTLTNNDLPRHQLASGNSEVEGQGDGEPEPFDDEALLLDDSAITSSTTSETVEADGFQAGAQVAGRWRLAINVPTACLQDMLPVTQLLSATQQPGSDYGEAKSAFLGSLGGARQEAGRVNAAVMQPGQQPAAELVPGSATGGADGTATSASSSVLPGLQELTGGWMGSIQIWGDVQGASNVEFALQGKDWKWGAWRLDRLAVVGVADSDEGVVLEELSVESGPARASLKGALLGSKQDAQLHVIDFPLHMLQPLYQLLPPALQGQVVDPSVKGGAQFMRPFASLSRRLEVSMARLSARLLGGQEGLLSPLAGGQQDVQMDGGPGGLLLGGEQVAGPVSGLLFVDGWLGGSPSAPEASVQVNLEQGAVGSVMLKKAAGQLLVDSQHRVSASVQLTPAGVDGSVSLEGLLHVQQPKQGAHKKQERSALHRSNSSKPSVQGVQGSDASEEQLSVRLAVRDGGMSLLCALTPTCQWHAGSAALDVHVHGSLATPAVEGSIKMAHASLVSPLLKHPVTQLATDIKFTGSHMVLSHLDGKVGKSGRLHAVGSLPVHPPAQPHYHMPTAGGGAGGVPDSDVSIHLDNIELRVANTYSGMLDAALLIDGSVTAPSIGGSLTFSRGTLNLQPPAPQTPSAPALTTSPAASNSSKEQKQGGGKQKHAAANQPPSADAQLVQSAFAVLRAGRKRAVISHAAGAAAQQASTLTVAAGGSAASPSCQLANLQVVLGPELRAYFPVVLNVAISGQITLNGPLDVSLLSPSGALLLESGSLNLVATQFVLDREHTNRLMFLPEGGLLDPVLDVQLMSGDLRATLAGRGSNWQDALSLTASGTPLSTAAAGSMSAAGSGNTTGAQPGGTGTGRKAAGDRPGATTAVELTDVARVFEERLAEALLGDNGQLALRSLASSTLHTLLPKLETRGQLGAAKWRLVGAPALPNLLGVLDIAGSSGSPAPAAGTAATAVDTLDPARLLSRLAVGTELELMWGDSLTAALQHKLLSDSKIGTEARLTYKVTRHVRLNLQLQGLTRPSITLGYTSDAL